MKNISLPVSGADKIPNHLPDRLSICCFIWNWIVMARDDEPYGDLEAVMAGLHSRGFNAIRVEAGLNWCFDLNGNPRGPVKFRQWIEGHSQNLRSLNAKGGAVFDVLERVILLMELAKKYDIYVILTSWEYQDSSWFLEDQKMREEIWDLADEERFQNLARQHDRLLNVLKERGLSSHVAFVEVHNEPECSQFWTTKPFGPGWGMPERCALIKQHNAEAIAFLSERHSELLITADFTLPDARHHPDNMQVYDSHWYAGKALYDELYKSTIKHPDFDPGHPELLPVLQWILKKDFVPYEVYLKPAMNVRSFWRPISWFYDNIDNDRFDFWCFAHFGALEGRCREDADKMAAFHSAEAKKRDLPLVMDEGGFFFPPLGSNFEESAACRIFFEYLANLAVKHGYWGFMPTTYCGPEHPLWDGNPEWLFKINATFRQGAINEYVENIQAVVSLKV